MDHALWKDCLECLERELTEQQLSTWIRPLHAQEEGDVLRLLAPNRFVLDWVRKHHLAQIEAVLERLRPEQRPRVLLEIGSGGTLPAPGAPAEEAVPAPWMVWM